MLVVAAFSRYPSVLDWGRERLVSEWGDIALSSEVFPFENTTYYESRMGQGLKLVLHAFRKPICPQGLSQIKRRTNEMEEECARLGGFDVARPLNLDPGYLCSGKFLLASTKDASHRIYLQQGVFAEVTLYFCHGEWRDFPWTYPNYRESRYKEFLKNCRQVYLNEIRSRREA